MPTLDVAGACLSYEVHGTGPWLAFAHGAGGNHLSWWQQVPAFADRHRCLVYDQRGWGRSSCDGPADPAAFATDLEALLDHVGAERAALVGQSMGGWTVFGCTLRRPQRISALVLTGTVAGLLDDAMLARLIEMQEPAIGFDPHLALAANFPTRDPQRTFLYDEIAALNPPPSPAFLAALLSLRYAYEARLAAVPITFIAGDRDRLFPLEIVRRAHAKIPHAGLVVIPGAGHSPYFESALEFNRALGQALATT